MTNKEQVLYSGAPHRDNVGAVVVTYAPEGDVENRLTRIARQVACLVIVDNGSDSEVVQQFKKIGPSVQVISNKGNLGIAAALNQGLDRLLSIGMKWGFTFDQDSLVSEGALEELSSIYWACPEREKVALIGAGYSNRESKDEPAQPKFVKRKTVITSGSLLRLNLYNEIGRFDEVFFIDHVDHDYCLRAWTNGYIVIRGTKPVMVHSIGSVRDIKVPFGKVGISLHPPSRYYYRSRNQLLIARQHWGEHKTWIVKMFLHRAISLMLIVALHNERGRVVKQCFLGYIDGFRALLHK